MRVLVIGGTGFIGRPVAENLIAGGHDVAVFHRGRSDLACEEISGDRDKPDELKAAIHRFRPEVVLDMILFTEPQALSLVEAARGVARRLVIVSSADVYRNYDGLRGKGTAPPDVGPSNENGPLRETRFPYRGEGLTFDHADDYDKIPVEQVVSGLPDLPATILRLPAVYGPGDESHRLRPYLKRMADGRSSILLSAEQAGWRWTRGYVENVAAAIAVATTDPRAAGQTYNVGEERTSTEREWVERIGSAAGWKGRVVTVPAEELPEALRPPLDWRYDLHTSTARMRDQLAFAEPIGAPEAMRRSVEWERASLEEAPRPNYALEDEVLSRSSRPA